MPSLSSSIKFLFCSPATCYSLYLRPLLCQPQSTQLLCLGSSRWLPKLLQVQEMIQVKTVLLTTISFASSHKAIGPHCWLSSENCTLVVPRQISRSTVHSDGLNEGTGLLAWIHWISVHLLLIAVVIYTWVAECFYATSSPICYLLFRICILIHLT